MFQSVPHKLALRLRNSLPIEPVGQPGRRVRIEIPAHRIRPLLIQHRPRDPPHCRCACSSCGHPYPAHGPARCSFGKAPLSNTSRADGKQRIEPAARLIDGLADEVGREALFKFLFMFKGIVPLCKGHGAGIIPAVDDFRHPLSSLPPHSGQVSVTASI